MKYIKLNRKFGQRGTTLIELSVVIAVILLLAGVLFIGIQAWRDGANKAACIVNISSTQKAVRGYQNMNGLYSGTSPLAWSYLAGTNLFFSAQPTCPAGGSYALTSTIPLEGSPALTCSITTHVPSTYANW